MGPVWQNLVHRTVRTPRICVRIVVYNCRTQHSTEQFWLSSLLTSRQASQLIYCLLEGRGGGSGPHLYMMTRAPWAHSPTDIVISLTISARLQPTHINRQSQTDRQTDRSTTIQQHQQAAHYAMHNMQINHINRIVIQRVHTSVKPEQNVNLKQLA